MAYWRDICRSNVIEIAGPALEPISRNEAKRQMRIDVDQVDEDQWIDGTILAARRQVERDLGRTFVRRTLEMTFDQFPSEDVLPLPWPPLISVTSVTSFNDAGVAAIFANTKYLVDANMQPGRLLLAPDATWPDDVRDRLGGTVRWVAGYSGASVGVSTLARINTTVTVTTSAAHGWATGDRRTIAGAVQAAYNGTFAITVTGATTFTYELQETTTAAATATGTIIAVALLVPEGYLHAIKLLIAHWFRAREVADPTLPHATIPMLPLGYDALISDRLVGIA